MHKRKSQHIGWTNGDEKKKYLTATAHSKQHTKRHWENANDFIKMPPHREIFDSIAENVEGDLERWREREKRTNHAKPNRNKYVSKSLLFDQRQIREDNRDVLSPLCIQCHRSDRFVCFVWAIAIFCTCPIFVVRCSRLYDFMQEIEWCDVWYTFFFLISLVGFVSWKILENIEVDRQFIRSICFW